MILVCCSLQSINWDANWEYIMYQNEQCDSSPAAWYFWMQDSSCEESGMCYKFLNGMHPNHQCEFGKDNEFIFYVCNLEHNWQKVVCTTKEIKHLELKKILQSKKVLGPAVFPMFSPHPAGQWKPSLEASKAASIPLNSALSNSIMHSYIGINLRNIVLISSGKLQKDLFPNFVACGSESDWSY